MSARLWSCVGQRVGLLSSPPAKLPVWRAEFSVGSGDCGHRNLPSASPPSEEAGVSGCAVSLCLLSYRNKPGLRT